VRQLRCSAVEDVAVMQQPIKHGTHSGDIVEQFRRVFNLGGGN